MKKMIATYLKTVIARLIVNYLMFGVLLFGIFIAYTVFGSFESAIKFLTYFTDNTFGKIVATLPFILAWFNLDVKGGANCHNIYYGYYY